MNYSQLPLDKQREYDRRVLMGLGELVGWDYVELVEETEELTGEDGKVTKNKKLVPVTKTEQFYVGSMSLYVTSGVISILSAVFVNGSTLKRDTGRTDNLALVEFLDEYHLSLLLSLVMNTEREFFLGDKFNIKNALKVIKVFLKYNDFFGLLNEVQEMAQDLNIKSETARKALLGENGS